MPNVEVAEFLSGALQWITEPSVLLWDRGGMHKGDPINQLLEEHKCRLDLEPLPAHAPKLNPLEQVWTWLKYGRLCNLAPADVAELRQHVWDALVALKNQPQLLTSFILHAGVPLLLAE